MPEENQNYILDLATLAQAQQVDNLYEDYRKRSTGKEEGELNEVLNPLNSMVTGGRPGLEDLLTNAQPQAIEKEVKQYHQRKEKKDDEKTIEQKAIENSGNRIVESYVDILNGVVSNVVQQISSNEQFSRLTDEQKVEVMKPEIYRVLVAYLNGSELNPKPKALSEAKKKFEGLEKPDEKSIYETVDDYLQDGLQLSSNAINLVDKRKVYDEHAKRSKQGYYERIIASGFVKYDEKENKYSVDKAAFTEAYGSDENYKRMAYNLMQIIQQQQRQRQAA